MDIYRYDAFISYRHTEPDRRWAKWLHASLERFRTPRELVLHQGLPPRVKRIFRDEEELPASADLSSAIEDALRASRFLIVICSPRAPESRWVDKEVERFRELGRDGNILALLIEGEPAESFPHALREIRREITSESGSKHEIIEEVEPLAADVRSIRRERPRVLKRRAKLRVLACILGCRFDDLRQRHAEQRRRRLTITAAVAAALLLVLIGTTIFGIHQAVKRAESDAYAALAHERERQQLDLGAEAICDSVYLAVSGTEQRQVTTTAWVAAPGILATSSTLLDFREGPEIFVRPRGENPIDIPVDRYEVHPGPAAFAKLRARLAPIRPTTLHYYAPPCDIALLYIEASEAHRLAPPLTLATRETLRNLRGGTEVAYVGFPGNRVNVERPLAISSRGFTLAVSDFFYGQAPFEEALFVQLQLHSVAGAAGAPIITSNREVVALFSGSEAFVIEGRRISYGASFGTRADAIREMLDGTVEENMKSRVARWTRILRADTDRAAEAFFADALQRIEEQGDADSKLVLERRGETGSPFAVTLDEAGPYAAIAIAEPEVSIRVGVRLPAENRFQEQNQGQASLVLFRGEAGQEAELQVVSETDAVPYRLRLYRLVAR